MLPQSQGSIATFGYRDLDGSRFPHIVRDIDLALQRTDAQPRRITWDGDHIAMIDRDGTRIALGFMPAITTGHRSYLILAVGHLEDCEAASLGAAPNIHLADRLLLRIKDDLPYDTIMRGETLEPVNAELMWMILEQLKDTSSSVEERFTPTQGRDGAAASNQSYCDINVIEHTDLDTTKNEIYEFLSRSAEPTQPLRLTVHLTGLMVMLVSAPLGAFMFTYSLLRDIASTTPS